MQEALTDDLKLKYAIDVGNAVVHLLDTIRKQGRPLSVMIDSDGKARIHLDNKRSVIDNVPGELNTVHREDVDYPWKYTRDFMGLKYYAVDCGGEE